MVWFPAGDTPATVVVSMHTPPYHPPRGHHVCRLVRRELVPRAGFPPGDTPAGDRVVSYRIVSYPPRRTWLASLSRAPTNVTLAALHCAMAYAACHPLVSAGVETSLARHRRQTRLGRAARLRYGSRRPRLCLAGEVITVVWCARRGAREWGRQYRERAPDTAAGRPARGLHPHPGRLRAPCSR